ncbi:MoxR family ATPase [Rhodobacterales bacterium FZCC0083]|nr:MoxR family ATPase [Rhodobacterales bacterium FZCC0083]
MSSSPDIADQIEDLTADLARMKAEIAKKFIGQKSVIDLSLTALLSGGHGLLVGVPGLGKTLLVNTLGDVLGLHTQRVQFTPDLMPADILGSEILETKPDGTRQFKFIEGPIFSQLLMADEINRASPRTQSALLQAMQEGQVSIAGQTRPLPQPFHVLATQNPIEQEGTYPLPEAQLDRFLLQITLDYPDRETEREILLETTGVEQVGVAQVFDPARLMAAQKVVRQMPIGNSVVNFILDLVRACRPEDASSSKELRETVAWGPGPRAAQSLMLSARAWALLQGRLSPSVQDVLALAVPVLAHRMALRYSAQANGVDLPELIRRIADQLDHARAAA